MWSLLSSELKRPCLEGPRKVTKILNRNNLCLGSDMKPGPPEYKDYKTESIFASFKPKLE
jgi:hypothetical protein